MRGWTWIDKYMLGVRSQVSDIMVASVASAETNETRQHDPVSMSQIMINQLQLDRSAEIGNE